MQLQSVVLAAAFGQWPWRQPLLEPGLSHDDALGLTRLSHCLRLGEPVFKDGECLPDTLDWFGYDYYDYKHTFGPESCVV